ncbi:hypothetical protein F8S13_09485 [Chloroflexia bacterium SDU3-3]|nr:hypothetical protein F8S13_09485 [Chloroflexia bacterium SDU3-3]
MRTYLRLKHRLPGRLPPAFREEELRYPEELAAEFIGRLTRQGERVLDPFAGYGTTLAVAESMGREGYGVEIDERRAQYARGRLRNPERLLCADSRQIAALGLPPAALAMSAPPFMASHERENVLRGAPAEDAYGQYLDDLAAIYAQVRGLLAPGGHVVIEVANLKDSHGITTLAWDVARSVGQVLRFAGEVVITWDRYYDGYDHSYCLLFRADEEG